MADKTPGSPDSLQLRGAPLASARLSRKAALVAVGVLSGLLGVILVNLTKDKPKGTPGEQAMAQKSLEPALSAAKDLTNVPDVVAAAPQPPRVPDIPPLQAVVPPLAPPLTGAPAATGGDATDPMLADSTLPGFSNAASSAMQPAFAAASMEAPPQSPDTNSRPLPGTRTAAGPAALAESLERQTDLNQQEQKAAFRQQSFPSAYLGSRLKAPASPFELKTGTVIPGILVGAVNSDLPGEVIAQVSQNVYDTVSGNYLLVPQGARLFGHYDSQITFGQERALVSWQRLIYPDGSTLELGAMPADDQSGNAGLADRVNNHYGRIFGYGLLTSVLSAGLQLSQPQQQAATGTVLLPSNQQVAAAAVGQQMAELGAEIARRNMQVQPTIQIRKGYRLNVMVNKDMVFPGSYAP
jgi:type IV secretion system protein TrbI